MKRIRTGRDAVIMAMLVRPMARWLVARLRRRAMAYVRTTIDVRTEALRRAALPVQAAVVDVSTAMSSLGALERRERRSFLRQMLIAGALAGGVTLVCLAVVAAVRRKRRARRIAAAARPRHVAAVPIATPSAEDELRAIKGIGTETSKRLRGLGITSLAQIAAWGPDDISHVAGQLGLREERIAHEDWVGQARAALGATTQA